MGSPTTHPTLWGHPPPIQPYGVNQYQPYGINAMGSTLWDQPPPNHLYEVNHQPTQLEQPNGRKMTNPTQILQTP